MGRKSKKNRHSSGQTEGSSEGKKEMSKQLKSDLMNLVNQLIDKCTQPFSTSGVQEWKEFLEVNNLVEQIRTKQKGFSLHKPAEREQSFDGFVEWLKAEDVDTSSVAIENYIDEGYGLKTTRQLCNDEKFLSIPRRIMLTSETAQASCLAGLIAEDRILQAMPNVVLSLHLLCEAVNAHSFYAPYIRILPDSYSTALYYTQDELQLLKGSPVLSEVLGQRRNIARQYAYFYRLFQMSEDAAHLPIKDFCYDDYRWAVSSVMTRQNQVPSIDAPEERKSLAMIPLWDMCNHCEGLITTDYDIQTQLSECYAIKPFSEGEQIYIYYGKRSNAELLLHNGFVFTDNKNDKMAFKLGVSKNDPLFQKKADLISKLSMIPHRLVLYGGDEPVDSDVLAFLRIFNMTEEELDRFLDGKSSQRMLLRDIGEHVSCVNEVKTWEFMETRCVLLLRGYPNTITEDEELLQPDSLLMIAGSYGERARHAVQLRKMEKHILQKAYSLAVSQKQKAIKEKTRQETPVLPAEDIEAEMANLELL